MTHNVTQPTTPANYPTPEKIAAQSKLGVFKAGYAKPQFLTDSVDGCLEWIGEQLGPGCSWAKHLHPVLWEDGSYTVHVTRTDEMLYYTIGPIY